MRELRHLRIVLPKVVPDALSRLEDVAHALRPRRLSSALALSRLRVRGVVVEGRGGPTVLERQALEVAASRRVRGQDEGEARQGEDVG
jgi:hypothetical protein